MRDLPRAIAMMVKHAQPNFENNRVLGKITEEAHTWSAQHIAEHLAEQGIDVGRHQVWGVLHQPGHEPRLLR